MRLAHLFVPLAFISLTSATQAETLTGIVVAITDGDTLKLLVDRQQYKVRIDGIDAPEKVQPFGSKSQANLGQMAFQKQATAECPKRDRYGRLVCKVFVDSQDVGLKQIADGMAWWYRKYAKEQSPEDRATYEQAETIAKLRRVGLWSETNPTAPWDWRKLMR